MSSFPDDIIVNIISKLPVKDISRFKSVCKSWCKLFSDFHFVKMHLNHSIQNKSFNLMITGPKHAHSVDDCYESLMSSPACYQERVSKIKYPFDSSEFVQRLGSYNGLCCVIFNEEKILCWNPSTKHHKLVPPLALPTGLSPAEADDYRLTSRYGFGYDSKVEDYKLVKTASTYDKGRYIHRVHVHSLLSDSWKSIPNIPSYLLSLSAYRKEPGVFVNGAIHWRYYCHNECRQTLISFDLSSETISETMKPKHIDDKKFHITNVSTLEGQLCLLVGEDNKTDLHVWVAKDYRLSESWTLLFTINAQETSIFRRRRGFKTVQAFKNGEVLFEKDGSTLVLYDPNSERARIIKIRGVRKIFLAEIYMPSLVSPNLMKNAGAE